MQKQIIEEMLVVSMKLVNKAEKRLRTYNTKQIDDVITQYSSSNSIL